MAVTGGSTRERYQAALVALAQASDGVRSGEVGAASDAPIDLEALAKEYIDASEAFGADGAELATNAQGDERDYHSTVLTATIGGDFKAAEQLLALAVEERMVVGADGDEDDEGVALAAADLPPNDFPAAAELVLAGFRGEPLATVASADAAGSDDAGGVKAAVDAVLGYGGAAVQDVFTSMAWAKVGGGVGALAEKFFSDEVTLRAKEAVDSLNQLWHRLAKVALRALRVAVEKIAALMGADTLKQIAGQASDWVEKQIEAIKDSDRGLVGYVIGQVVGAETVVIESTKAIEAANPSADGLQAVTDAVGKVTGGHERRMGYVGWGAGALGLASGSKLIAIPHVAVFCGIAAAGMMAFALWQTHDALDAPRPAFIPDLEVGVRSAVVAAL